MSYIQIPNLQVALRQLEQRKIDALVYDKPILQYLIKERNSELVSLLPDEIERQNYEFGLPSGSALREYLNYSLLEHIEGEKRDEILQKYLGDGQF